MNTSAAPYNAPPPLPGFRHIHRYWDNQWQSHAAKILPGQYYVTRENELMVTVLGSCIAACIRDRQLGIGGMNHFMLPLTAEEKYSWRRANSAALRYGNVAMEHLINSILKFGGQKNRLEVKIFGGGRIMQRLNDIGARNIEFVKDYIRMESLRLVAEQTGEIYPRKVVYHAQTGGVKMKKLKSLQSDIIEREKQYLDEIQSQPVTGQIDLF